MPTIYIMSIFGSSMFKFVIYLFVEISFIGIPTLLETECAIWAQKSAGENPDSNLRRQNY